MPRSDLVLFVTSADRPFSESERAFLEEIRDWGKKIVVVLNKIDLLEDEAQIHEVVRFISDNAQRAARHRAADLSGLRPTGRPR